MATCNGNIEVMQKLIDRGANLAAIDSNIGSIISTAIFSGNIKAVELVVGKGASFKCDVDVTTENPPLPPLIAAVFYSDVSMFKYLVGKYANILTNHDYSEALVASADFGRTEVFRILLGFPYETAVFQEAIRRAAGDRNWDIAEMILKNQPGLDCNDLFYTVAASLEPKDDFLVNIWQYTSGRVPLETLNASLYAATDGEKESTVRLLLSFGADANAIGET
jgi:ankyrin repeat protein